MIDPAYEKRIRRALICASALCLCALLLPLLSLTGVLKPQAEPTGQWLQRSGAVMTVVAAFVQFKAGSIAAMLQGTAYADSWEYYRKYICYQSIVFVSSLVLVIIGTLIWGYGDLLLLIFSVA